MKGTRWKWGAASAALLLGTAACSSAGGGTQSGGGSDGSVIVGVLAPFSGGYQITGKETLDAVKAAVNEINAAGGIKALGGKKLKIVTADSSTDVQTQAATAASQLLRQKPDFIIGPPISTVALPASTVTERAQVPMCVSAFDDQVTSRGYKYIFEVPPKGSTIGSYAIQAFKEVGNLIQPPPKRVAVFWDSNPANQSGAGKFASELASQTDSKVVAKIEFPSGATNLDSVAAKIKAANPDILVPEATIPELEQVLGSLSSMGVSSKPIFWPAGGSATFENYAQTLGKSANGQFVVAPFDYDMKLSPAQDKLLATAVADYKKISGFSFMSWLAGGAYACTNDLVAAIEKAGSTKASDIRSAMINTTFDSGPGSLMPPGKVDYNESGLNTAATLVVGEWCNGLLHTVAPTQYASMQAKSPQDCGNS